MSGTSRLMDPLSDSSEDNPVGRLEEYLIQQDWGADRTNEYELWTEIPSQWGSHRLWVVFHEDTRFLQLNCYLNIKIPRRFFAAVAETMALLNERIWLGHFEIWTEEYVPVFRVVVPLRGSTLHDEQVDDLLGAVYQESERFYPTFQWIIWGGKTPAEAVSAAMLDTEGEA
ncbi:MAG: YbjN domain-containing protein [Magnetococcus sp. WYHC-3]